MAFAIRNLSVLAYAQGFTLWHYKAGTDHLADVTLPGFFDDAADMLTGGDMLMVCAIDGGNILCLLPADGEKEGAATAGAAAGWRAVPLAA
jgi:predicted alpha/beta hydrolase